MRNGCQLITYPDSMGGSISSLRHRMERYFSRALTGVHILPFYPSSGDRAFLPWAMSRWIRPSVPGTISLG